MPTPTGPYNYRSLNIFGECMVYVRGAVGGALSTIGGSTTSGQRVYVPINPTPVLQLGLTDDAVQITPEIYHEDIHTDSFGPRTPADCIWRGGTVQIVTRFVHYDPNVLDACLADSMAASYEFFDNGGVSQTTNDPAVVAGTFAPIGTIMGGLNPLYAAGSSFMTLWFDTGNPIAALGQVMAYRFPACYMTGPPVVYPLGTERTIAECRWRAIPYVLPNFLSGRALDNTGRVPKYFTSGQIKPKDFDIQSNGAILWDRQPVPTN